MGSLVKLSVDERLNGVFAPGFFYDRRLPITKPKQKRTAVPSRPSAAAQNIWLAMRSFGSRCGEDQHTIAAAAGKSDRHVRTYLPELIEQGWLIDDGYVPVPVGSNLFPEQMPKRYVVTLPEWAFKKRADAQPPAEDFSAPPRKTLPEPPRKDLPSKRESLLDKTVSESFKGGVGGKADKTHTHPATPQPPKGPMANLLASLNTARNVLTLPPLPGVTAELKILDDCLTECGQDAQRATDAYREFLLDPHWKPQDFPTAAFRKQLGQYLTKAARAKPKPRPEPTSCQHPPGKHRTAREWDDVAGDWVDITKCTACGATVATSHGKGDGNDAAQHGTP